MSDAMTAAVAEGRMHCGGRFDVAEAFTKLRLKVSRSAWNVIEAYVIQLEKLASPAQEEIMRLHAEIDHLKRVNEKTKSRCEAQQEIFRAAARGGNETAKAFVDRMFKEFDTTDEEHGGG